MNWEASELCVEENLMFFLFCVWEGGLVVLMYMSLPS